MLSEDHIELIKAEIEKSSITVPEVKDDLLDHFCCSIENYMHKGFTFETAYAKTFVQVCPSGLNQIQNELILQLNLNKIMGIQKLKYSLGLITSICISVGSLFKAMFWPGANYLLFFGLAGLVILFLPMLAYDKLKKKDKSKSEKLRDLLGFASTVLLGTGIVFKIGHLTGAGFIILGGTALFAFGFLPFLFFEMYKKSLQQELQKETSQI